jgi:hypothetical protein
MESGSHTTGDNSRVGYGAVFDMLLTPMLLAAQLANGWHLDALRFAASKTLESWRRHTHTCTLGFIMKQLLLAPQCM